MLIHLHSQATTTPKVRAAIHEFDGGQSRAEAEVAAVADVARSTGCAASRVLRIVGGGKG